MISDDQKSVLHTEALSTINEQILAQGESLPQVTLKDGSRVQTGTVATMLYNIRRYNAGERGKVEEELRLAIPTLVKVGLFELFSLEEWKQGDNPGRTFIAREAEIYLRSVEG